MSDQEIISQLRTGQQHKALGPAGCGRHHPHIGRLQAMQAQMLARTRAGKDLQGRSGHV